MVYEIFEGNMERLEKKLNRIFNKCKAFGCNFHYAQIGETFKELVDDKGKKYMARFIQVEAEGTAVINDWEFVASVEHTENGNIFKGVQNIEVPARYYDSKPVCEHCFSNRYRKYTYIVHNKVTGEFKQVGKSCLKDFTHGMSAEAIAQYISLFDSLIQGNVPEPGYAVEHYLSRDEYLAYAAETIRHFGYVKSGSDEQSTASRAMDYYEASKGHAVTKSYLEHLQNEMIKIGFNPESPEITKLVKDALEWIGAQKGVTNYIHNLKTACSLEYVSYRNFGLLASLFPAYNRALKNSREYTHNRPESHSEHVGNVGDTISFRSESVRCMASWETDYGTKRLLKMADESGNVFIWKTGVIVNDTSDVIVTGEIKAHDEFRGVKQTELTRCKIVKAE